MATHHSGVPSHSTLCLFHDKKWRGDFQHLINQLRVVIVPVKHLLRLQRLVCICNIQEDSEKDPEKLKQYVTEFDPKSVKCDAFTNFWSKLVSRGLWNTKYPQKSCWSARRLIFILSCAVQEDYEWLVGKEQTTNNLGDTTLAIRVDVEDFTQGYLGLMVGKKGRNIGCCVNKCGCRSIRLALECTWGRMGRIVANITYPVNRPSVVNKTKDYLEKTAKHIVYKRKLHFQRQRDYRSRVNERRKQQRGSKSEIIWSQKEANTRIFERHKESSKKLTPKQEHVCKLEGSHCLNCLATYTTELFQTSTCQHHPGYKVVADGHQNKKKKNKTYRWTCCNLESLDSFTTTDEHKETGCTVHIHNWRPDRRQKKGDDKFTGADFKCFPLQQT